MPDLAGCKPSWNAGRLFDENGEIKVSAIGQEFVIDDPKAESWAINLINKQFE